MPRKYYRKKCSLMLASVIFVRPRKLISWGMSYFIVLSSLPRCVEMKFFLKLKMSKLMFSIYVKKKRKAKTMCFLFFFFKGTWFIGCCQQLWVEENQMTEITMETKDWTLLDHYLHYYLEGKRLQNDTVTQEVSQLCL